MDGDVPDLAAFIAVARRHRAWLMVDEAHALGVLGPRGFGLGRPRRRRPRRGRHLDGDAEQDAGVVRRLYRRPQGPDRLSEAHGARALCSRSAWRRRPPPRRWPRSKSSSGEPERVRRLNERAALFLRLARDGGLDVGGSVGAAIVPIITGSSIRAGRLAQALFARGINVQPILYPAVPERAARLRFFLTAAHSEEQVREAVAILLEEHRAVAAEPTDLAAVARHLGRLCAGRCGLPTGRLPRQASARPPR